MSDDELEDCCQCAHLRASLTALRERADRAEAEAEAVRALLRWPGDFCLSCGGDGGHEEACRGTTGLLALQAERDALRERADRAVAALRELGKHPEECDDESGACVSHLAYEDCKAELAVLRNNQLGPVPEGPLKALGAWIADHTDEDEWAAAERYLNAALAEMEALRVDAEIGQRWNRDSSLETWFPYTAEELARLRLDETRINKLAHMALYQKVSIVDTGVIPYRVCLNGAVLGSSLREVIDKAIVYPPMEAP